MAPKNSTTTIGTAMSARFTQTFMARHRCPQQPREQGPRRESSVRNGDVAARSPGATSERQGAETSVKHRRGTIRTVDGVTPAPLTGFTVGVTGHRRWEEQAEMLSRRGARVVHGATMATSLLGDLDETLDATHRVLAEPVDTVVLTTGIGTRSWFAAAESAGLDDALRRHITRARIVARGPKALHAARAEGLEVEWAAPGETNDEVVANLVADGLGGRRLVVQRDGGEPVVARALEAAGAEVVIDVPIYRWHLPADHGPALRLLEAATRNQLDAVTFTSAHAVHNAFGWPRTRTGWRPPWRPRCWPAPSAR